MGNSYGTLRNQKIIKAMIPAELPQIIYCSKRSGNTGKCAMPAEYKVTVISRKSAQDDPGSTVYRCKKHMSTATQHKKVVNIKPFDQAERLRIINKYLASLIGKTITTNHHRYPLLVRYVKPLLAAVMCIKIHEGKPSYKLAYYHQIKGIYDAYTENYLSAPVHGPHNHVAQQNGSH